jgi:iron complex outermembrane receptor protein
VPGLFAQVEHEVRDDLTLAGSARLDLHSEYGSRLSPRLSMLYRPGPWTVRASLGRGFYAPTPFVEEIEAAGLSRLEPLSGLRAETAETASLDVGYARGPVEATASLFASNMNDTTRLEPAGAERVRLVNVDGQTRIRGSELLLRYRWRPFTVTGSYVYVDATEPFDAGRRPVRLTPRHTAGLVAMWEEHGKGRLGIEAYYTGRQQLEDNPYRSVSRPYVELGLLGEVVLGRVSLFVNAENILGVRQTRYDPLLRPSRAADGRWTVDVWAPTDGFVVNGGLRLRFGGH